MGFRSSGLLVAIFGLSAFSRIDPRLFMSLQGLEVPSVRDGQKGHFQAMEDRHAARFPKESLVRGHQALKTRHHHNSVRRASMNIAPKVLE